MTDEAMQVPLGTPKLEVRVIASHKGKEPGPFAYLQGMKSGLLTRVNRDPEKTQCAIDYTPTHVEDEKVIAKLRFMDSSWGHDSRRLFVC